ncbi:MAG: tetratricopeptide repeat protein [Bacteroidota bacterium]
MLYAKEDFSCADCAAYESAVRSLEQGEHQDVTAAKATSIEQETILKYHRRRTDPDSILLAGEQLLQSAAIYSQPYAFAAFSVAESHLKLFNEPAYERARSLLQPLQFEVSLRPLVDFYLLVLDATYDQKFTLNAERISIRLLNAISEAEQFHPEMVPDLMIPLCEAYSYLGLFHLIIDQAKYFKSEIKSRVKDELDAIKYDHGLAQILHSLQRYQKAGNMQEQAAERLLKYPERLPALLANCYFYAGEACYRQHRDASCLPLYEAAVQTKRRKDYIEMYVAILSTSLNSRGTVRQPLYW